VITGVEQAPAGWSLVDWDGNPDLKFQCWRKKFGHGDVSVGVGDFEYIVFSYGANSSDSYSSTRNLVRIGVVLTEMEAMEAVDRGLGKEVLDKYRTSTRPGIR
jgi:hypothetical protein